MSDETPTIAEDLETLEAFFGAAKDGARWQLPNCGDYFNGAEVVGRLRAELERPAGGPRDITANIGRVLRLAYTVDVFEAGEGKLDGVADLLRKLAAALRRDVDAERARLRAEDERLTDALSEANRRLESRNDTDAAYYYERDRAKAAERERDAAQYASREAWSRVEFLEANVLISGSDADREYRRRWPVDEDERP